LHTHTDTEKWSPGSNCIEDDVFEFRLAQGSQTRSECADPRKNDSVCISRKTRISCQASIGTDTLEGLLGRS
jgi:hypothetical protein